MCYNKDMRTHGYYGTPTYKSYHNMKCRCNLLTDEWHHQYYYNIEICDRWIERNGFANFLEDMGERPVGTTLDRIDNNKGYSPDNCRWATNEDQMRNTRFSLWWFVDGVRYESETDVATSFGVHKGTVRRWFRGCWRKSRSTGIRYWVPPHENCWTKPKYS
jgi:hypothetical protein